MFIKWLLYIPSIFSGAGGIVMNKTNKKKTEKY